MDRQAFTTGQLVPNSQLLGMEKAKLVALGYALEAIMGAGGTVVSGLACTQTTSPSLSVVVGRGSIMTTAAIDPTTAYSDLGTDTNATIKQGILQEPGVTLTLTPPSTAGYSQVYLIQATQSDSDTSTTVPFYNASNPAVPYNGPSNSGNATLTLRQSKCIVSLKAGAAATTGSQVAPSADTGNVGLYTITLANGQTTITTSQVVQLASAPFVPVTLPGVPGGVQSGSWTYATDTGSTTGALVAALSPIPASLPDGAEVSIKATRAAAGSDTLNLNGFGALPIKRRGGLVPSANDWAVGDILILIKSGSTWQLSGIVPSDVLSIVTTSGQVPVILQSPTLYVRTDGNDTTGDGSANTAAKAFATIGAAATYGKARYYLAGVTLTIQLGNTGTYAAPGNIDCGGGSINLVGSAASQGSYTISGSGPSGGASALVASINGSLSLNGLTISNTGSNNSCVAAAGRGSLSITNVTLATTVSNSPSLVQAYTGGLVTINAGCILSGSASSAMAASSGYITMAASVTVSNGPAYTTAYCSAINGGVWSLSGSNSFTGTATGTRYYVTTNGVINTNGSGASFFPGSAAGITATGGQYV